MGRRCTGRWEDCPSESHPLQASGHRPLQEPPRDTCNGFLPSSPPPLDFFPPLLWRPRLPPGVVTSSRPPRAPGLARPRHPAASGEKSEAELRGSPEETRRPGLRGPGTGISRPAAAAEGGGLERGPALVIRVPGPGGGRAGSEREVRPPWNLDIARGKPRAGGLWRRRVAGPALVAGPGAWWSVGGVALGGCQIGDPEGNL